MIGINVPIPVPLAYHTFGGWKKSAFGDLNQHGPDSFKFYTRTKTDHIALAERASRTVRRSTSSRWIDRIRGFRCDPPGAVFLLQTRWRFRIFNARRSQGGFSMRSRLKNCCNSSELNARSIQASEETPMDFALSEEQIRHFRYGARFRARAYRAPCPRMGSGGHDPERAVAASGSAGIWRALCLRRGGGAGLSRLDATLVFEALSMACPSVAAFLSIHNMCAKMLDTFASDELKARYMERVLSMETVLSYCLTEPGSGSDAAALKTRGAQQRRLCAERDQGFHFGRRLFGCLCRDGAHGRGWARRGVDRDC
jgi:hypothetical protein